MQSLVVALYIQSSAVQNVEFVTCRSGETDDIRRCRIGMLANMLLSTTAPKLYKFVASAIGVELWRQGTSHAVFKLLQRIGITQSVDAARRYVDALGESHDKDIKLWKADIEVILLINNAFCVSFQNH